MRTRSFLGVVCLLVFLAVCGGCEKRAPQTISRGVDLVRAIHPVSTDLANTRVTIEALAGMQPQVRLARLRQDWPRLEESLVYFLRSNGRIRQDQEVRNVDFRFGSLEGVEAEDATGRRHRGYFENQLVARVSLAGVQQPIDVLVNCLNGLFALPGEMDRLQPLYTAVPQQRFRIARREGLVHHVDYPVAMDLAQRFNLDLYQGRRMVPRKKITPQRGRELEPTTNRLQVTVKVYPGDEFDLVAMRFTPSSQRPRR